MNIQARRVYRLAVTVALSLLFAYALQLPLPYLAPILALILTAKPGIPIRFKQLIGLWLVVIVTLGVGLMLIPMLLHYSVTALVIVAAGLYVSFYLTVAKNKVLPGTLLLIGLTLVSAMGTVDFGLAIYVIKALLVGITIAVISQWIVYPLFPEDFLEDSPSQENEADSWLILRGVLIVLPVYLMVLINPTTYTPLMMKGALLAQQSSLVTTKNAGRELIGSTLLGGVFAILIWMLLSVFTHLWMFFLLVLLLCLFAAAKMYVVISTKLATSFWQNVVVTTFILLGPAVEDSNNGDDVYTAFFFRMSLFLALGVYAVLTVHFLEFLKRSKYKCA